MSIAKPFLSRRHRSTVLAICAVLVAAVILAGPAATAEQAKPASPAEAPRIAVDPASFDFGKVLPLKSVSREFVIRNFGKVDLVIENVSTSCGCTAALLDPAKKVVKAGGTAPLRVTLTTPANAGRITKSVLVRSNDPERPSFEIKLQATIVAEPQ
jgi:hypothetical protein